MGDPRNKKGSARTASPPQGIPDRVGGHDGHDGPGSSSTHSIQTDASRWPDGAGGTDGCASCFPAATLLGPLWPVGRSQSASGDDDSTTPTPRPGPTSSGSGGGGGGWEEEEEEEEHRPPASAASHLCGIMHVRRQRRGLRAVDGGGETQHRGWRKLCAQDHQDRDRHSAALHRGEVATRMGGATEAHHHPGSFSRINTMLPFCQWEPSVSLSVTHFHSLSVSACYSCSH